MVDRKEYQKQYYLKNKKKLSRNKKSRYHKDKKYRNQILERSRMNQLKQKTSPTITLGVLVKKPKYGSRITSDKDGNVIIVRTITELAKSLGVRASTIRSWHLDGIIPPPTIVDSTGRGWYDNRYVLNLRYAYVLRKSRSKVIFKQAVEEVFNVS